MSGLSSWLNFVFFPSRNDMYIRRFSSNIRDASPSVLESNGRHLSEFAFFRYRYDWMTISLKYRVTFYMFQYDINDDWQFPVAVLLVPFACVYHLCVCVYIFAHSRRIRIPSDGWKKIYIYIRPKVSEYPSAWKIKMLILVFLFHCCFEQSHSIWSTAHRIETWHCWIFKLWSLRFAKTVPSIHIRLGECMFVRPNTAIVELIGKMYKNIYRDIYRAIITTINTQLWGGETWTTRSL